MVLLGRYTFTKQEKKKSLFIINIKKRALVDGGVNPLHTFSFKHS